MNKKIIVSLILIFCFAVFVSAVRMEKTYPGTVVTADFAEQTYHFSNGWNLVPGILNPEWVQVNSGNIKAIFAFNPVTQEYVRFYPRPENNKISGTNYNWESFASIGSMWVYSDQDFSSKYWKFGNLPLDSTTLFAGWNFISVTNEMKGLRFDEIKGNCDLLRVCDYQRQNWECIGSDQVGVQSLADTDSDIGLGLVIKVSENCKFGISGGSLTPPSIPELPLGDNTGLRKDIENYYYQEYSHEECTLNKAEDYTSKSDCEAAWRCISKDYAKLISESDLRDLAAYMKANGGEMGDGYYRERNPSISSQINSVFRKCLSGKHESY